MKRSAWGHPKLERLGLRLDLPTWGVVGIVESFWQWVGRYAPSGDVSRDLELMPRWIGYADGPRLIAALLDVGLLDQTEDGRLYVHDWHEHADDSVKKTLAREGKGFWNGKRVRRSPDGGAHSPDSVEPLSGQCPDTVEPLSGKPPDSVEPLSVELPDRVEPALPSLALPCLAKPEKETRAARAPRLLIESAWQELTRALARHGRDPTALRLTPARERAIRSRLGEGFPPDAFGHAADGYRAMHGRSGSNGFDPDKHFTPDTLLRPSHFAKYVEAAQAQQSGRRAWEPDPDAPPPRMYT